MNKVDREKINSALSLARTWCNFCHGLKEVCEATEKWHINCTILEAEKVLNKPKGIYDQRRIDRIS